MRLTLRTALALQTLVYCATHASETVKKHDIALALGASENHLAQVINQLARKGYVRTFRGRNGGICLNGLPAKLCLGTVVRDFEHQHPTGPQTGQTTLPSDDPLNRAITHAGDAFFAHFDGLYLADILPVSSSALAAHSVKAPSPHVAAF